MANGVELTKLWLWDARRWIDRPGAAETCRLEGGGGGGGGGGGVFGRGAASFHGSRRLWAGFAMLFAMICSALLFGQTAAVLLGAHARTLSPLSPPLPA